jgi:uncharacterized protein YbjT (DUF2867 family)
MDVVLFGATGMIGQGVLRECLQDRRITSVRTVGRRKTGAVHEKLTELERDDLYSYAADEFATADACLFCLGVSAAGSNEAAYTRITYDLTMAAARAFRPGATFIYVSGAGTNEASRQMWARVKGRTERELLESPLDAYLFRPGFIQPLHGERSRTRLYNALYVIAKPLFPVLRRLAPGAVTTTEAMGKAMIKVALSGYRIKILEPKDINAAAQMFDG